MSFRSKRIYCNEESITDRGIVQVLITDAAAAFCVDRILLWLAGEGRLNIRV